MELRVDLLTGRARRDPLLALAQVDPMKTGGCCQLSDGHDPHLIKRVREQPERDLGHRDVSTTMIHTHVLNRGGKGVLSPADCR